MKRVKQVTAGLLFTWSFLCLVMALYVALNPKTEPTSRREVILSSVMLGPPAFAGGLWLVWRMQRQAQQQVRDRLQAVFFELLRQGQGYVSVLPFSMQTELSADEAKAYLDQRAKEFQADFHVSESGKVFYYFDVDGISPKQLGAALPLEQFDVILESCPDSCRSAVVRILQRSLNVPWSEAKALVRHPHVLVQRRVDRPTAETLKKQLEAAGATVLLVVKS